MDNRDTAARDVCIEMKGRGLLAVFALLLLSPVLLAPIADHGARALWEKRDLQPLPSLQHAANEVGFFEQLEAYIDDHLFGALALNRAYRRFQYTWLRDSPVPNVALGPDQLVFLTSHSAAYPRQSVAKLCRGSDTQAETLHEALQGLAARLAARGVSLTVAVVPSKLALYSDRLPPGLGEGLRARCAAAVPASIMPALLLRRQGDYRLFYPFEALRALRDTPHFYPPENFHADSQINHEFARLFHTTQLGEAARGFGRKGELRQIEADLQLMGFERQVLAWRYDYADFSVARTRRVPDWLREVYPRVQGYGRFESAAPLSTRRAFMLSDSFGAFLAPHLAPAYADFAYVNLKSLRSAERTVFLDRVLRETQIDELIILVHDAGLPNPALRRFLGY